MDVRLAQMRKWQEDRYYLKIVMILKRINRILTEAYVDGDDRLDETTYQALKELLEAISLYENGQTDPRGFAGCPVRVLPADWGRVYLL